MDEARPCHRCATIASTEGDHSKEGSCAVSRRIRTGKASQRTKGDLLHPQGRSCPSLTDPAVPQAGSDQESNLFRESKPKAFSEIERGISFWFIAPTQRWKIEERSHVTAANIL